MTAIEEIFEKFVQRKCSAEEIEMLLQHFGEQANSEHIMGLIQRSLEDRDATAPLNAVDTAFVDHTKRELKIALIDVAQPKKYFSRIWMAAAACILAVAISSITYYKYLQQPPIQPQLSSRMGDDALPGSKRAHVTLSTGERLDLNASQSSLVVKDGKLYDEAGRELINGNAAESVHIATPTGGEYQVRLPDGTQVWLNAESSLTYPVHFATNQRKVQVSGEVYLEVAADKSRPFVVNSDGQEIQVLGTAFNIRNYRGKTITTLIHGKISLQNENTKEQIILVPSDQALLSNNRLKVAKVDAAEFTAWRSGLILDKDATLIEISHELQRWYGVSFVFPDNFKRPERAVISLNRDELLSSVLSALEDTYNVHFTIKGKEVHVH